MSKTQLRKVMKQLLRNIPTEAKQHQSVKLCHHLLTKHVKFRDAKHIAIYLAMKHEELDLSSLIETILTEPEYAKKKIYIPHVEPDLANNEMCFYELKSLTQYKTEMNKDNKFKLPQFNEPQAQVKVDMNLFDLVVLPGLAFDQIDRQIGINRLGRGKGYYDRFLEKIQHNTECHKLGIGFNEQFIPLNMKLINDGWFVPMDDRDMQLDEFVCEKLVS